MHIHTQRDPNDDIDDGYKEQHRVFSKAVQPDQNQNSLHPKGSLAGCFAQPPTANPTASALCRHPARPTAVGVWCSSKFFSELEREKKKEEKKKCAASNCRDRHEGNVSRQTWQLGDVPQWSTQARDGLQYAFNGSQQNLTALFL